MSFLGDAVSDLFESLHEVAGYTVSYTRGVTIKSVRAIKAGSQSDRVSDGVNYGTSLDTDFIFLQSDLESAAMWPPERHDKITWTDDTGATREFRIDADGFERHYAPVGQFGNCVRIHAVEI